MRRILYCAVRSDFENATLEHTIRTLVCAVHEQEAFKRNGCKLFYMDPWSSDELRQARDALYPDMSDSELNDRIYR